jgi:integrase
VAPTIIAVPVTVAIPSLRFPVFNSQEGEFHMERKGKRARGSGSIFQNGSNVWWVKYSERGVAHRESSQSTEYAVAEKLLKRRLAEVETKTFVPRGNVRVDELVEDVLSDYKEQQLKSIESVRDRWRLHLFPFFRNRKASDVTTDLVRRYIKLRTEQSAKPGTINRELSILRRAFNLALESTPPKMKVVPYIPMLKENNRRTGFLRDEEHSKLAAECAKEGLWLRAILAVAYNYAWRRGELLGLRVRNVDLYARTIRLDVGTTKNGEGRLVKMTNEVLTLMTACVVGKKKDDFVFTREDNKPVKDFRKLWWSVCVRAGISEFVCSECDRTVTDKKKKCECGSRRRKYRGLLVHDLRRTGARNLRRLGVSESVAMVIGGWKTESVFRRYDIIDETDIADAANRLDEKAAQLAEKFGQSLGIIAENSSKSEAMNNSQSQLAVLPN